MIENPTEWFQANLVELENGSKRKEILLEMKSLVVNSEKSVLSDIAQNVSLHPIFEYLQDASAQEKEVICIVAYELLKQIEPAQLLKVYGNSINTLLTNTAHEVKEISLKLLEICVTENTIEYLTSKQSSLLVDAAECLASSERSTAQCAISVFTKLGSQPSGVRVLYSSPLLKKFQEVMSVNDTSRFRVYEIVVAVSKISAENLAIADSNGLLKNLMCEIYSSDILIQLNALEIFSNLVTSNHGLNYLLEYTLVQELVDKLLKVKEEPLSLMLLPGLIEFFGNVCVQQPEQFAKDYPQVINLLFNSLDTSDVTLLGVIISTVGKIGSSCSGRLILMESEELMKIFFNKISQLLKSRNDLTITAMNSLCELLKSINGDPSCNDIAQKWLDFMGTDSFHAIIGLAKLPFPEFRLSAFSFLKAITTHLWGTIKLYNSPGMVEFLLDRSSEFNKDCKQMKYEVVCNMVSCPNAEHTINPELLLSLKEFVREGPFFVPVQVEMATEGAN